MTRPQRAAQLCGLTALIGCAVAQTSPPAPPPINVLFVGNSLTSVNDLPGTFDRLTSQSGSLIRTHSDQSTHGGAIFRDHAWDPTEYVNHTDIPHTIEKIRQGPSGGGHWDFVALQDQSGSYFLIGPENYNTNGFSQDDGSYRIYCEILANETRAQGGIPIFLMTWHDLGPDELTPAFQQEVDDDYSYAAGRNLAMCAPCGNAALLNMDNYPTMIYQDDVHPTQLTQYTNACVFYATLTNQSPVGLGLGGVSLNTSLVNITILQEHAWNAYLEYRDIQMDNCTATQCVRFLEDDGSFFPLPVAPTTTTTTLPPLARCSIDNTSSTSASLSGSSVVSAGTPLYDDLVFGLTEVCPSDWELCYSGSINGWRQDVFHGCCDDKGPTLVVLRAGDRTFGGFASASWTSVGGSTSARGGYLWRLPPNGGRVEKVSLDSADSISMQSSVTSCIWLGRWEDLRLRPDCRTAHDTFVYNHYQPAPPSDFDNTWLAGNSSWVADSVEVFYTRRMVGPSGPSTCNVMTMAPTQTGASRNPTSAPPTRPPTRRPTNTANNRGTTQPPITMGRPPTTPATQMPESKSNGSTGIIIGGVVSAVVILAVAALLLVKGKKLSTKRKLIKYSDLENIPDVPDTAGVDSIQQNAAFSFDNESFGIDTTA